MGKWAKKSFGFEEIGNIGIVVAGTSVPKFEKLFVNMFDKIVSRRDRVYHSYIVKYKSNTFPIVFNVYGSPAMVDLLAVMHDGGCRNIIFLGAAYGGFKKLEIASLVIPKKSYHFEGIYHPINPDKKVSLPDKNLVIKLKEILNKEGLKFEEGTNISVPAVTFQMPHANEEYKKLNPTTLEMELASCFSRAKEMGIRAAGVLWISDNRSSKIGDTKKKKLRIEKKKMLINAITKNLKYFGDRLNIPYLFQVVLATGMDKQIGNARLISADKFLTGLI